MVLVVQVELSYNNKRLHNAYSKNKGISRHSQVTKVIVDYHNSMVFGLNSNWKDGNHNQIHYKVHV